MAKGRDLMVLFAFAVVIWVASVFCGVLDMFDTGNQPVHRLMSMLAVWTLVGLPLLVKVALR